MEGSIFILVRTTLGWFSRAAGLGGHEKRMNFVSYAMISLVDDQ